MTGTSPKKLGDVCSNQEFVEAGCDAGLVFDYVPKLAAICLNREAGLGRRMTREEFDELKLRSAGVVVSFEARDKLWRENYLDIRDYAEYVAVSVAASQG